METLQMTIILLNAIATAMIAKKVYMKDKPKGEEKPVDLAKEEGLTKEEYLMHSDEVRIRKRIDKRISRIKTEKEATDGLMAEFFTIEDVAKVFNRSKSWVSIMVAEANAPHSVVGRRFYFTVKEVHWLKNWYLKNKYKA